MLKTWDVHLHRDGRSQRIGEVQERTETLARCAALSRFGVSGEEAQAGRSGPAGEAIYPDDEFEVTPRQQEGAAWGRVSSMSSTTRPSRQRASTQVSTPLACCATWRASRCRSR